MLKDTAPANARLLELADAVGTELLIRVSQAVCQARAAHPHFACGPLDAYRQIRAEMLEWEAQASLVSRPDVLLDMTRKKKADAEALDVIVTLLRWLGGEFDMPTDGRGAEV